MNTRDKPWGWELIVLSDDGYLVKQLTIMPLLATSQQYHTEKVETLLLVRGSAVVVFGMDMHRQALTTLEPLYIPAGEVHQIIGGPAGATLIEVSSPEIGRTVRVSDPYGRGDEELGQPV